MQATHRRAFATAALLVLAGGAGIASDGHTDSFERLSRILKPGDTVAVTDRAGVRANGQVAELTACSISVVGSDRHHTLNASAVREIRLIRRRDPKQERTADSGGRCKEAPCMAMSLALAGTSALTRGMGKLFARPKTIYRADGNPPAPSSCTASWGQTGVKPGSDQGQTRVRPGSDQGQTGVRPGSDPNELDA